MAIGPKHGSGWDRPILPDDYMRAVMELLERELREQLSKRNALADSLPAPCRRMRLALAAKRNLGNPRLW